MINQLKKCLLTTSVLPIMFMAGCQTPMTSAGINNAARIEHSVANVLGGEFYIVADEYTELNKDMGGSEFGFQLQFFSNDPKNNPDGKNNGEHCYSTSPLSGELETNFADMKVVAGEYEIIFINFTENGRLETYSINNSNGTENNFQRIKETAIKSGQTYKEMARELANASRTADSFKQRNMRLAHPSINRDSTKYTPFYLYHGNVKRKGLIYVLLDEQVQFIEKVNRVIVSHVPQSSSTLFTPYLVHPEQYVGNSSVMLVDFYRGGDIGERIEEYAESSGENVNDVICRYPYDLGLVMKGQSNHDNRSPVYIDPENEAKGPPN